MMLRLSGIALTLAFFTTVGIGAYPLAGQSERNAGDTRGRPSKQPPSERENASRIGVQRPSKQPRKTDNTPPRIDRLVPAPGSIIVDHAGLQTVEVGFTEPVSVPNSAVTAWTIGGGLLTGFGVSYLPATNVLTISFNAPIRDGLTIVLGPGIVDSAGNELDGEIGNPGNATLPSGDGLHGGQAVFRIDGLGGDANRDGRVDAADAALVHGGLGRCGNEAGYDANADLNNDGCVNVLDAAMVRLSEGRSLPSGDGLPPTVVSQTPSLNEEFATGELGAVVLRLSEPVRRESLTGGTLYARRLDGVIQNASAVSLSNGDTVATFTFEPALATGESYDFVLSNAAADRSGQLLAAPGVAWSSMLTPPPPTKVTDTAFIVGKVFNAATNQPLAGAFVAAANYPSYDGDLGLPPITTTNSLGEFRYETVPVEGNGEFLLRIRLAGFAENLRRVSVLAGRCWRVDDAYLNPVNPPVFVNKEIGATLTEPTGKVTLIIPPNALMQDATIGITPLGSADAIRDKLPQLVAPEGTFVDLAGVFGDQTKCPVTLRVPNEHSLPVGTPVRFGKIDHNTLQWMDLCDAFGGGVPDPECGTFPPDFCVGKVTPDGAWIEVQFTHFCTVCTGLCLNPSPPIQTSASGGNEGGPPTPPCGGAPGTVSGSSVVHQREGYLTESVALPGFQEMGRSWGLSLGYSSPAADPSVTLSTFVDYDSTRPVQRTLFEFSIEGVTKVGAYGSSQNNEKVIGTYFWNGRNGLGALMPTGSYPYSIVATSLNASVRVAISGSFGGPATQEFAGNYPGLIPLRSNEIKGRVVLVNRRNSPYGAGWSLLNEHRLEFDPDGCIVLVLGNADWRLFVPRANDPNLFDAPAGDFSILTRQPDGSYIRAFTDGATDIFSALGLLDRRVDRYGYVTEYTYDNGRLTSIISPTGYFYSLAYDGNGKLAQITDSAGRVTTVAVDASSDLAGVTDPTGATRLFHYDAEHLLTGQTGSRGERTEYVYENGRVVQTLSYDTDGTTLLRGRSFDPSALNGEIGAALAQQPPLGTVDNPIPLVSDRIDVYTDGRDKAWTHESDLSGTPKRTVDPLQRTTQYTYDANRLLTSRVAPNTAETKYEYDSAGYVTKITEIGDPSVTTDDGVTTFEYNGPFHQVSRLVDPEGKPTTFEYFPNGNLSCIEDALHNRTCFFYDDPRFPDVVTRIVDALNHTTRMDYDAHGHVLAITDPLGRATRSEYDPATGNLTAVIDPRPTHPTTRTSYDARNRVRQITDAIGGVTTFDYGESACSCSTANLTGVTMPNNTTITYDYDGLDRLVKMTDQLGHFSTYVYDPEGDRTSWTNRNGEAVTYAYDAAGQLIRKDVPGTGVTTYRYDPLGSLVGATNPAASLGFLYDLRSRMIQATQAFAPSPDEPIPFSYTIDYQYDRAGNRTRMQTPDVTIQYVYDALHRLTTLTDTSPADPQPYTWTFAYDALSRRTRLVIPNGTHTEYAYDNASQVASILHKNSQDQTFSGVRYTAYDEAGNSTAQTWIQSTGSFNLAYSYDKLSRLVTSTPPPAPDVTFTDCAYQYDDANRLVSDCEFNYQFDAEGRQTEKGSPSDPLTTRFIYDAEGRLREIQQQFGDPTARTVMTAQYAYDPLGRRVEKGVNGVTVGYTYDGANVLAEVDGSGTILRNFTQSLGVDQPLSQLGSRSQDRVFLHADRLGSIIAITTAGGLLTQENSYDAFGSSASGWSAAAYTAREHDRESDIGYYRSRYYDAFTGRFLREDPVFGSNLYAYVRNNPVNAIDPLGLWGMGIQVGGNAEFNLRDRFGEAEMAAAVNVSTGSGVFWGGNPGLRFGGFESEGAFATSSPKVGEQHAVGGYAGYGGGFFLTNARSAEELSRTTITTTLDVWLLGSIQLSQGPGVWYVSVSVGPGFGAGTSTLKTNTFGHTNSKLGGCP